MSQNVWTAASDGDLDSVKAFLASGGDVNAKDENGYTALYCSFLQAAASYGHAELVGFLVACGADLQLGDNDRDTPLHLCETVECATLLLEAGADVNARNADGRTPYDVAIDDENEELMAMYADRGADKSDATMAEEDASAWSGENEATSAPC